MNQKQPTDFIENPTFDSIPQCLSYIIQKLQEFEHNFKNLSPNSQDDEFLDMESAADFLHLSVSRLYTLCQKRSVPFIKNGKKNLFIKEDLRNYMISNKKRTYKQIAEDLLSNVKPLKRKGDEK